MALDKSILHGKDKRKPYRGGKAISRGCRNHGNCDWCEGNRTVNFRRILATAELRGESLVESDLPTNAWSNKK